MKKYYLYSKITDLKLISLVIIISICTTFLNTVNAQYCSVGTTNGSYWISNVSTTGGYVNLNNTTAYSAGGYGDFSTNIVSQSAGNAINFNITMSSGTHGINIWVDWNNDFDFTDAGESVFTSGGYVGGATGSFNVPVAATNGIYRMRIVADWLDTNPADCGTSTYSEAEDYSIQVTPPPTCYTPENLVASATSSTSGTSSWTLPTSGNTPVGYEYVISTANAIPTGSGTFIAATSVNFTTLTANTTYYVFIRSDCGGSDYSSWSSTSFYTGYCSSTSTSSTYYINDFTTTGGTANINNLASGYSLNGYGDFTAQSVSQINFGSVDFSAIFFNGTYTYGFNIWVDWNDDFDFDDANELVYASGGYVNSAAGSFVVPGTASVGNHTLRIRANYLSTNPDACGSIGSGETEDYTFTVLPPLPCADNPENISVFVDTQTSATVNWTEPLPAPTNGYQYYLSTTNSTPSSADTPTGSVAAGVTTLNLTGLTSGTTYYIWIRSDCGGALGQGVWVGPISFYMPTCAIGNGNGTTTLGCPSVISGGLGLNGADPSPINCGSATGCVDLEATYLDIGDTSDYLVESIAYSPPYQFECLRNPVSVNQDDVWSPLIDLPFDFCFYDNSYSSITIGSNGTLSFDTSNAGNTSGYSFNDDLPSTTGDLFENTIYGVYHDIDPSVAGEVGWELITLNTGCRALIASWHDVPMFSDNTIFYTGMIVLYENTNIIEVYIEEKNIDNNNVAPWNGGNAIVGIQNSDATIAHVAPGRNGLDTNWSVTNEAWRFVPNGTSITSLTWYEGSGTTGTVLGNTDVINVCPTNNTTYTAEVTYTLCDGSTLIETEETTVTFTGGKVWNGSVDNNWNTANNWTPTGAPTNTDCVIIPDTVNDPIISGTTDGIALNLRLETDADLTIQTDGTLTLDDFVNISPTSTFQIENSGSLIQINNVANTGNILLDRTANIRGTDYVYWSSPVANFPVTSISPTTPNNFIWEWIPTIANNYGNWTHTTENMINGKGYIVRGPNGFNNTPQNFTAIFSGVPNNGDVNRAINRGTYNGPDYPGPSATLVTSRDDNWNLIGNPYPSALDVNAFLTLNTDIEGAVHLWSHDTALSNVNADPFYEDYSFNYSNLDYITHNGTGTVSGPFTFNGYVASGQAFFVLMNEAPTPTSSTVVFNNSMRSSAYDNSDFFRTSDSNQEKHRIWLDLISNDETSNRILIGYVEGATLEKDRMFDARNINNNSQDFYSLINSQNMLIQGRPIPFDEFDSVPLGVLIPESGIYSIAIGAVDGLFSNNEQNIFLEDTELNIFHDLKNSPYSFSTDSGTFNNRFILRYNNPNDIDLIEEESNVHIYTANNHITASSNIELIESILVHDVLGRVIFNRINVNNLEYQINNSNLANGTLLVKVRLVSGEVFSKKIIL